MLEPIEEWHLSCSIYPRVDLLQPAYTGFKAKEAISGSKEAGGGAVLSGIALVIDRLVRRPVECC